MEHPPGATGQTRSHAGLATAITDAIGVYHFSELPAGKYCLRIDPDHGSGNEAILLPGSWTVIPSGHEGMTFRVIAEVPTYTPTQIPPPDCSEHRDRASCGADESCFWAFIPGIPGYCKE